MKLLLDTCTFLWLIGDSPAFLPSARSAFQFPGSEVFLSAVSAWEIAVKHGMGKLELADSPEIAISEGRARHRVNALPFDERCAFHLPKLPTIHRDPFDWMLICQAIEHDLTILTPDPMIRKYPIKTLW